MEKFETVIYQSYKMELIGTGFYQGLAKQYRKKYRDLSRTFIAFSGHEAMHAELFRKYYEKTYDKKPRGGFFWKKAGRMAAFFMRPVSLEKKMKKVQAAEQHAVDTINKKLAENLDPGYLKILSTILPHERAHACLYAKTFSG